MKQGRTILAGLLTVVVVLGGFFLPNLVAEVQARNAQPVQVETGPAQLFSSSDLSLREKLVLMSSGAYVQSVEVESARYLAEEEAEQYSYAYALGFSQAAMEAAAVEVMNVQPYYNMFTTTGAAFYIWECYIRTEDGSNISICLDDETGCLLQLSWIGRKDTGDESDWNKRVYAARDYLMDVCATALGAVYDGSIYAEQSEGMAVSAGIVGQAMYCHLYEPETDEMFDIPVWYNEVNFYFNMFP